MRRAELGILWHIQRGYLSWVLHCEAVQASGRGGPSV